MALPVVVLALPVPMDANAVTTLCGPERGCLFT